MTCGLPNCEAPACWFHVTNEANDYVFLTPAESLAFFVFGICAVWSLLSLTLWRSSGMAAPRLPSPEIHGEGSDEGEDVAFLWLLRAIGLRSAKTKPTLLDASQESSDGDSALHMVDHAKFFMNAAIIGHHCIEAATKQVGSPFTLAYACWVESFVMATFAYLSGLLSKGELDRKRAERTVCTIWATYFVLTLLLDWESKLQGAIDEMATGCDELCDVWALERLSPMLRLVQLPNVLASHTVTWYLQCWITWKLLLPYLRTLPTPTLIAVGFAISWYGGYWVSDGSHLHFHLDTSIALLPFFLLGFATPTELLRRPPPAWLRWAAACVHAALVCGLVALALVTFDACAGPQHQPWSVTTYYFWVHTTQRRMYFNSDTLETACGGDIHACTGADYWLQWCQRATYHLLVLAFGSSFLLMMPHQRSRISTRGRHSLYAYLLQIWLLKYVKLVVVHVLPMAFGLDLCHASVLLPAVLVGAPLATYALTSETCRTAACFIFEPTWLTGILYGKDTSAGTQHRHARSFGVLFGLLLLPTLTEKLIMCPLNQ